MLKTLAASLLSLLVVCPAVAADRAIAGPRTFATTLDSNVSTTPGFFAGDFDGDGHDDVLIATGGGAHVYRGDGTGMFSPAVTTSTAGYTVHGIADFDEDGKQDLYLRADTADNVFGIMRGSTGGAFGPIATTTANAALTEGMTAGDFDADGHIDLAIAFELRGVLTYFGAGDGTFPASTKSPEFNTNLHHYGDARNADVNGDGHLDAIFGTERGAIRVFLGDGNRNFTLGPAIAAESQGFDHRIAAGDWNDDTKADVLRIRTTTSTYAQTLLSSGTALATPQQLPVMNATDALSADLDGDAKPELLIASYTSVAVIEAGANAAIGRPRLYFARRAIRRIATGDFDGDSKLDVVALQGSVPSPNLMFALIRGNGDGTLESAPTVDVRAVIGDPSDTDRELGIADINGDARPDLFTYMSLPQGLTFAVLVAQADGSYAPVNTPFPPVSGTVTTAFPGDLNGDGKPDAIVTSTTDGLSVRWDVMSVESSGSMSTLTTWTADYAFRGLVDVTGDGKIDVIEYAGGVHPGIGNGTFGEKLPHNVDVSSGIPVFVDLDGDGILDELISPGASSTRVRLGNADGSYGAVKFSRAAGVIVGMGDMNEDGHIDIVSAQPFVVLGNGDGTFGSSVLAKSPADEIEADAAIGQAEANTHLAAANAYNTLDFDGDGHLDVLIRNEVWYGNGTGRFRDTAPIPGTRNGSSFLHDLDGTGTPEIVFRESYGGGTSFLRTGASRGTLAATLTLTPSKNPAESGDIITITARLATMVVPEGRVWVTIGSVVWSGELIDGVATVDDYFYPVTTKTVTGRFEGDDHIAAATATYDQETVKAKTTLLLLVPYGSRVLGETVYAGASLTAASTTYTKNNIILKRNGVEIGTITSGGSLTPFNDPTLFPLGTHTLTAEYPGDAYTLPAVSEPVTLKIVKPTPNVTLTLPPPFTRGQTALFRATIDSPNATGTVTFMIRSETIGIAQVVNDVAELNVPVNVAGGINLLVTAIYSGDEQYLSTKATGSLTIYQGGFDVKPLLFATISRLPLAMNWHAQLSPSPLNGATSYDLYRSNGTGAFVFWKSVPSNGPWPASDEMSTSEKVRLYRVVARDASGNSSQMSDVAIAYGGGFQDATLTAGSTQIKAVHFTDLQSAINALRAAAGLPAIQFRTIVAGAPVVLEDMTQLRLAMSEARAAIGLATSFTDALARGVVIHTRHLQELRNALN